MISDELYCKVSDFTLLSVESFMWLVLGVLEDWFSLLLEGEVSLTGLPTAYAVRLPVCYCPQ